MEPRDSVDRFYRAAQWLLPRGIGERWQQEMADLLRYRLGRAGSRRARLSVWVRAVIDITSQSFATRISPVRHPHRSPRRALTMYSDLLHAIKSLRSAPLFSLTAVITLALGIGTTVAAFSVVYAVLLRPLPYADPDRLVTVWPEVNYNTVMVGRTAEAVAAFEGVTGASGWSFTLIDGPAPAELNGLRVTPGHFELLGSAPALGRTFRAEDGLPDAPGVVILSHGLWMKAFAGDPTVLGRVIRLSGAERETHEVIGIMPDGYRPIRPGVTLWTPLRVAPGTPMSADDSWYVNTRIARLRPGVTIDAAQTQLGQFAVSARQELSEIISDDDARTATVRPLHESISGDMAGPLWISLGVVTLVLLSACANVTNLLLARGQARERALAVRVALGAGRSRIVSLLLIESSLIGAAAGLSGVGLAFGLVSVLGQLAPSGLTQTGRIDIGIPVVFFAVGLATISTLLAGLYPALRGSRVNAMETVGQTRRGAGLHTSRLMPALVSGQVALALVVAMGSGLMVRSLTTLLTEDPGVSTAGVLTFRANLGEGAAAPGQFVTFYAELLDRLRGLPGVQFASAIHIAPGQPDNWRFPTFVEGHDYATGEIPVSTNFRAIWPDYFSAVGIPVEEGRPIERVDVATSEFVVVVNRAFANRWWPGESPLGRTVRVFTDQAKAARIVGVVGDVRQFGLNRDPVPELYYVQQQWDWAIAQTLVVKFTNGNPLDRVQEIRALVAEINPAVPLSRIVALGDLMGQSAETTRFMTALLSGMGALAVLLGAVGVFGVSTYTVGARLPEFGVRLALGATTSEVVAQALRRTVGPVLAGLVLGVAGAFAATRLLSTVLYRTNSSDPFTFALVTVMILIVGTGAALGPSLRAGRVDPISVLGDS